MEPTGFDLLYKQICNPAKWGGKLQICLKTTINEWMRSSVELQQGTSGIAAGIAKNMVNL